MSIVIVEQGDQSSIDPNALPDNCKHILIPDDQPFNRWRCFKAGFAVSDPNKRFFIFSDNDIYIEAMDIRANLKKCEQYSMATGFSRIIHLTNKDTAQLYEKKNTRGTNITSYAINDSKNISDSGLSNSCCCFVGREVLNEVFNIVEDWELQKMQRFAETLQVFESPNHALRLRSAADPSLIN